MPSLPSVLSCIRNKGRTSEANNMESEQRELERKLSHRQMWIAVIWTAIVCSIAYLVYR